jgi:anthranilate synthase component 1
MPQPDLAEFLSGNPEERGLVWEDVLGDLETPVSVYWRLAFDQPYSFLLESVTGGEKVARYSFIGVRPVEVFRAKDGRATRETAESNETLPFAPGMGGLEYLRDRVLQKPVSHVEGMPPFTGGAVGMMAYDLVRNFEELPSLTRDDLHLPDVAMMICDTVVAIDHAKNIIRILVSAPRTPEGYQKAESEIAWVKERLSGERPALPAGRYEPHEPESNVTQTEFETMVRRMREYLAQGDGLQFVPSQRFQVPVYAHPLTIYRALRRINPSPYMFLLRFGDFDTVGASPEVLVALHGRAARVRPIAGTRWRGANAAEDNQLAKELAADQKERAEHVMLVDLGRNDLGRVCEYGSVQVDDLMVIERYSHVMHMVSEVTGTLRPELDALDLLRATFPAGTVSGAPKVRAMEIIEELEPTRRGLYAGAVGYLGFSGDLDSCIALRTILIKDGIAYVQAGSGIVFDSDPTLEYNESCNKARAALSALGQAEQGLN